jgi:myo-inositol-1-phosphate synthase
MSVRVVVLGAGLVGMHFATGLERIKSGEIEPYGVPFAKYKMEVPIEDLEIVGFFDVDESKIGRSVYEVAVRALGDQLPIPRSLNDVQVYRGLHFGSLKGLPFKARGLEEDYGIEGGVQKFLEILDDLKPDVVLNVITTENASPLGSFDAYLEALKTGNITASQAYAYALAEFLKKKSLALINFIPSPLANDEGLIRLYEERGGIVLGDDGATGATPLTADLLEHLAQRNRKVMSIAQFNIGGNTDFLALTFPERNIMKEITKSSVVEDILGYDAPHYIKPTGYLEPLGDKKFVAMHIWWKTFNGLEDELIVNMRINDSPALAGLMVDATRISAALLRRGIRGTVYEVNAFFMKRPGPPGSKNPSRIVAYYNLLEKLKELGIITS